MGNSETEVLPKSEKMSSPVHVTQEQPAIHPYPDWAAMQAYYGSGIVPPPYFATAVAPGHGPHPYMWGPQTMIPAFGSPYTAVYPHGIYPHRAVPFGSHAHCPGVATSSTTSETVMHQTATPLSMEMPKSSGTREKLRTKRLRMLNELSTTNCNIESTGGADSIAHSQSGYNSTEGSSDGIDGKNVVGIAKGKRIRSSEDIQPSENGKADTQANPVHAEASSIMPLRITAAPANIVELVGTGPSPCPPPTMEARIANTDKVKATGTPIPPLTGGIMPVLHNGAPRELWMQDEREFKREKRKQSNRESARRSRLRKQAETEELAMKVEALDAENSTLRSEISQLTENADKLRLQNLALVEKLNSVQSSQAGELSIGKTESDEVPSAVCGNFLSKVDNPSSINRTSPKEDESKDKLTPKLHQLLDNNPRTDAIAAS